MKNLSLLIIFILGMTYSSSAQWSNKKAMGLRLGVTTGFTVKQFYENERAWEAVIGMRRGNYLAPELKGFIEVYKHNIKKIKYLDFFFGPGIHGGYYIGSYSDANADRYDENLLFLGVDGIVGIEYKIPNLPVQLCFDISPRVDILGFCEMSSFDFIDTAISFRYWPK